MTTTPIDIDAIRAAVTTYDRLTAQWYDTDEEMEASYPAAKEALHTIKDAVPSLLAALDDANAANAALRNTARYIVVALDFPTPILLPVDIVQYLNAALGGDIHPNVNRFMSMSAQDRESNDGDER